MPIDHVRLEAVHLDQWGWSQFESAPPFYAFYQNMKSLLQASRGWRSVLAYELLARGIVTHVDEHRVVGEQRSVLRTFDHWKWSGLDAVFATVPRLPDEELTGRVSAGAVATKRYLEEHFLRDLKQQTLSQVVALGWGYVEAALQDAWRDMVLARKRLAIRALNTLQPSFVASGAAESLSTEAIFALLENDKRINLRSFDGIYQAFKKALGAPPELQVLLAANNPKLYRLSQYRHVIMHCAGKVDECMVQKLGTSPAWQIGEVLQLEKVEVADLLQNAIYTLQGFARFLGNEIDYHVWSDQGPSDWLTLRNSRESWEKGAQPWKSTRVIGVKWPFSTVGRYAPATSWRRSVIWPRLHSPALALGADTHSGRAW